MDFYDLYFSIFFLFEILEEYQEHSVSTDDEWDYTLKHAIA